MNSSVIAVSSEVTGNISACKVEVSQIITARPSFFIEEITTFAVNNCTGEMIKGQTYALADVSQVMLFVFCILLILMCTLVVLFMFGKVSY